MKNNLFKVILLCFFGTTAFSQLHFGAGGQLIFDSTVFGVQGKLFYEYDDTWRAAGTFTLHLDNAFDFSVDLDAHYKLIDIGDNFNLAPVVGLSIIDGNGGTTLGLNVGAFFDFDLDGKHVYAEPKFIFRDGSAIAVSGGIFF